MFICDCNIHLFVKLGNRMLQERLSKKVILRVGTPQGGFFLIVEIIHLLIGKSMVSLSTSSVRMMVDISY